MLSTVGCAPPSLVCAHDHTAKGSLPNHSVVAIGTTPTANRSSCPVKPALTTRLGLAGTTVCPKAWVIVTALGAAVADVAARPAAIANPAAPAIPRKPRLLHCGCIAPA